MLANQSNWNSASLIDAFLHRLADYIKDALVSHDLPPTLDGIIELVIRVDLQIQARGQLGRSSLTPEERELQSLPLL